MISVATLLWLVGSGEETKPEYRALFWEWYSYFRMGGIFILPETTRLVSTAQGNDLATPIILGRKMDSSNRQSESLVQT